MNKQLIFPVPEPQTISRVLEGESVLVIPQRGLVNVLNELGQFVWQRVDGKRSVDEIVAAVCSEYDVTTEQAHQDVLTFLRTLSDRGALRLESREG